MDIDPLQRIGIGRRALLTSGAAALGAGLIPAAPAWARPSSFAFPDPDGLRAMIAPSLAALGRAAQVERLGESAEGRPIDLVSIGSGDRSALVVGAPHPNEPIGCLTIAALIRRLAQDRRFREQSDCRWHFIAAIDVDGLALNRGWLRGPQTLDSYMRHFFRPSFARQPEYSFPLAMPGYRFDTPTPENLCWQRAMAIARPGFQSSLHGNDSGGAFYLISQNRSALAARLSRQPAQAGIALNRLGEPDAAMESYAPGVFSYFEVAPYLASVQQAGEAAANVWSAGRSSAEFAAETYGTFSMTCEVPLWEDPRQFSERPSRYGMADILQMQLEQMRENARLLDRAAPLLARDHADAESRALASALGEAAWFAQSQIQAIETQLRTADTARRVPLSELVQLEPGTTQMRTPAMLARLARLHGETGIASPAAALLAKRIARQALEAPLRPIPVARSIALQIEAIMTSMAGD